MDKIIVNIGNKTYNCKVAKTDEEQKKGLMGVEYLAPDEGMLFIWKDEGTRNMWMKNCPLPIDQIAINDDDEVIQVYKAIPNDETLVPFENTKYILEVNTDSGIVVGDDFEIDGSDDLNKYVMKVLAPDGSTQGLLQGGERIFSRISTKKMIKQAKKADSVRDDETLFKRACRKLGKICLKELYAQNHREQEYVQVPED